MDGRPGIQGPPGEPGVPGNSTQGAPGARGKDLNTGIQAVSDLGLSYIGKIVSCYFVTQRS